MICGRPGEARDCCNPSPVLCDEHDEEHRRHFHRGSTSSPRTVDEALYEALQTEGFDED